MAHKTSSRWLLRMVGVQAVAVVVEDSKPVEVFSVAYEKLAVSVVVVSSSEVAVVEVSV